MQIYSRNVQSTLSVLETDIKNLNTWSKNNGLVFDNAKLLSELFTFKRISMAEVTWGNQTANLSSNSHLLNYLVSPLIAI